MPALFCRDCGAEVAEHMAFCKNCGSEVRRPAAEPPPPRVSGGPSWWRDRRLLWASRAFLVLALLGTGVLVGWAFGSDESLVEAEPAPASVSSGAEPSEGAVEGPTMPDVRGLAAADARQVLADVGVAASSVSLTDQPAAGESGIVLSQDPVYGYPVGDAVTLAISSTAKVPEFQGRAAEEVLADLDALGAEVETRSVLVPGVPVGQVASITPPPGTVLPVAVTVVISAEPDELNLTDVVPVDDTCYSDEDSIAGSTFNNLLACSAYEEPEKQSWVVKRAGTRLSGVVGILDSGDPAEQAVVEVIGDGAVLKTVTARYGESTRLDVDVTGVLRLTIRYRSLSEDGATVGLGRLVLLGDAAALATLETYS